MHSVANNTPAVLEHGRVRQLLDDKATLQQRIENSRALLTATQLKFLDLAHRHRLPIAGSIAMTALAPDHDQVRQAAHAHAGAWACNLLGTLTFAALSAISLDLNVARPVIFIVAAGVGLLFARIAASAVIATVDACAANPSALVAVRRLSGVSGATLLASIGVFMFLRLVDEATIPLLSLDLLAFEMSAFCLGASFEARRAVLAWSGDLAREYDRHRAAAEDAGRDLELVNHELATFTAPSPRGTEPNQILTKEVLHASPDFVSPGIGRNGNGR